MRTSQNLKIARDVLAEVSDNKAKRVVGGIDNNMHTVLSICQKNSCFSVHTCIGARLLGKGLSVRPLHCNNRIYFFLCSHKWP